MNSICRRAKYVLAILGMYALVPAPAVRAATTGCSGPAAESDVADVGDACGAIISDPKSAKDALVEALFYRGLWHHRGKRGAAAKRDYDRALQLAPDHAKLLQLRANLHFDAGATHKAKEMAQRSAQIDPSRSKTFELLGQISFRQGDEKQALAYFNTALDLSPDNMYARYERAVVFSWMRRPTEALDDTRWLIGQSSAAVDKAGTALVDGHIIPLYLASQVAHAKVLRQLDRYEDAEAYYGALVAAQRTAFTLTQRSRFLRGLPIGRGMKNRVQDALADAEEAVRLDAQDGRAQLQLATLLENQKRYAEALAAVDLALQYEQIDSWVPAATWTQARVLRALGRMEEAVAAARHSLRMAWEVNPSFLMDRLRRLEQKGYWLEPAEEEKVATALDDAAAACMADEKCW